MPRFRVVVPNSCEFKSCMGVSDKKTHDFLQKWTRECTCVCMNVELCCQTYMIGVWVQMMDLALDDQPRTWFPFLSQAWVDAKMMGVTYVQVVVNNLNKRFLDSHVFNATKLFSPQCYPSDFKVRITMSKQWLERSIITFDWLRLKANARKAELLECVEMLRHEHED